MELGLVFLALFVLIACVVVLAIQIAAAIFINGVSYDEEDDEVSE